MSTINQRINVTFRAGDLEAIKTFASATDKSLSQAVAGLALKALEDYDDILLGEKALARSKQENHSEEWLSLDDLKKAYDLS